MMKSALRTLITSLLVTGALTACSKDEKAGGNTNTTTANNAEADKQPAVDGKAGGDTSQQLQAKSAAALKDKTIAFLPVALGISLTEEWWKQIKNGAEASGMKAVVRDPNWSTQAQSQALSALIADKPAVVVVHNPNVQLLAKQLEQAEKAGIYVIQVNMVSNYKTDAYVGADWVKMGEEMAQDIVKSCGTGSGKSGKVALIQGELTSATSLDQLKAAMPVFERDKAIKIVSNQAANWDATKAHDITATVVQQNPDLCAVYGFWDTMTQGSAQAIKEAGKTGQIGVWTSGDGARTACDSVTSGAFTKYWSYDARAQGRDIITLAKYLLQAGQKPGSTRTALYSPFTVISKDNVKPTLCFDYDKK